ncbi:hypothetical protein GGR51DRAFT_568256 [Nemania sp. FL0031]|nr:hypothetical protein GGR51DRAFT_568256 [Nemania sp. FL0031]
MPPKLSTSTALPPTFTCRVCGREKAPAAFSKNQIQKWYTQKRNDRYNEVTPQHAGLCCKDHSTDVREIRCHGPCDHIRSVDKFSKSQRNNPEPWCIVCTEWRLSANGNDLPPPLPNAPVQSNACGGTEDNNKSVNSPIPLSSRYEGDDRDQSDDSDDEDPLIIGLVDRLQGYGGLADTGEGITTDTMSTTNSVKISLWDEDTNDGKSNSVGVSTGIQPWHTQNSRTRLDAPTTSNPWRNTPHSQGYASTASNAQILPMPSMATSVAPHLNRLASGANMSHPTRNAQTAWSTNMGEGSYSSSRLSIGRPPPEHMSQSGTKRGTSATADGSPGTSRPSGPRYNVNSQESGNGTKNKWYKGDNRKVFPADRVFQTENRPADPHDSDSPDEM